MNYEKILETLTVKAAEYASQTVLALVLLIVAWIVAGTLSRVVRTNLEKTEFDKTLTRFFSRLLYWVIMVLALLACLSVFGIQTTSFAAIIGAAGLAVGLAFQGTLSHFAAGAMLLTFRPFKVGDVVDTGGQLGTIDEIGLFTTHMDTFDNRRVIIPNNEVFGSIITNYTYHPKRRVEVKVGVDYSAEIGHTREVLEAALAKIPGRLSEEDSKVVLDGLGASSVDWQMWVWAKKEDYLAVKQATIRDTKAALDSAGIGIPFPQMDVHLDPGVGMKD